ncbi:PAS domain-containing sensor histidine kinase [Salinibacter grassmerensis]|uniref:PAS domain-containing sensor histidine kinase n=1 Tax=Salinibacter grassmerensis TaxID=3040353 RepID=UPI0021E7C227|nr:ATP-binding protein [Salinibacter grassmerensis]
MTRPVFFFLLGACLLGAPTSALSGPVPLDSLQVGLTPMISAMLADGNGDGKPDQLGDTLAVGGRVTASPAHLSHSRLNVAALQDDTHGIHVRLSENGSVERGDSLIVRGRLLEENGLTAIDVAQYRVVPAPTRVPKPVPLTVSTATEGHYEGWLARTRGRVVDRRRTSAGRALVLESPDGSSSARLPLFIADRHQDRFRTDRFETGDIVEATGIVSQHGSQYRIEPRDSGDLVQTGLTWEYIRIALIILGGLAVVAVIWGIVLQGAVDRRTRQLEEAKRQSERMRKLFESVFEHAPVMIMLLDAEHQFERINEQFEDVLGWSEDELRARDDAWTLLYPDDDNRHKILGMIDGASRQHFESRPRTRDGDRVVTEWWRTELEDGRRLCLGVDVTERKERERDLRRAKQQAEAARQEAEDANRLKSVFLANMSHEIRTPLTSIIGFAETIGDEAGAESEGNVAQFASLIKDSGHRLLNTLNAVLNLSKLETGEMDLSFEPVDLTQEARSSARQFHRKAEASGVDLRVDTPDRPVLSNADEGGVQVILRNLISNAIKYSAQGAPVWVRVHEEADAAVLEVEDKGVGMNPDKVDDLFQAFRQASEGRARTYEGTGIGLAVTKKATDAMNGTVSVETEKGVGSRFVVRLLRAEKAEVQRASRP